MNRNWKEEYGSSTESTLNESELYEMYLIQKYKHQIKEVEICLLESFTPFCTAVCQLIQEFKDVYESPELKNVKCQYILIKQSEEDLYIYRSYFDELSEVYYSLELYEYADKEFELEDARATVKEEEIKLCELQEELNEMKLKVVNDYEKYILQCFDNCFVYY